MLLPSSPSISLLEHCYFESYATICNTSKAVRNPGFSSQDFACREMLLDRL